MAANNQTAFVRGVHKTSLVNRHSDRNDHFEQRMNLVPPPQRILISKTIQLPLMTLQRDTHDAFPTILLLQLTHRLFVLLEHSSPISLFPPYISHHKQSTTLIKVRDTHP